MPAARTLALVLYSVTKSGILFKCIIGSEAGEAGCAFSRIGVIIKRRKDQDRFMDEEISQPKKREEVGERKYRGNGINN